MADKSGFTARKHLTSRQQCKQCAFMREWSNSWVFEAMRCQKNHQRRSFGRSHATRNWLATADQRLGATVIWH